MKKATYHSSTYVSPHAIVHPYAKIGMDCYIGDFTVIEAWAEIKDGVTIGRYCEIRKGVTIESGTSLGSRVTISAGGYIGKNCTIKYGFVLTDTPNLKNKDKKLVGRVEDGAMIGARVVLMPGVTIGKGTIVGACSQVRQSWGENKVIYGNPAKPK